MPDRAEFSLSDARRIAAAVRQSEAMPASRGTQGTNRHPNGTRLEGFLLQDLPASSGRGTLETSAKFTVWRGEGDTWQAGEVETVINRDDKLSLGASDYIVVVVVNGELRPYPTGYGNFYTVGKIGCDPFDCAYPGQTLSSPCAVTADAWQVDVGPGLECLLPSGHALDPSGVHVLNYVSGCQFDSAPFNWGDTGDTALWRLTIDETGTCTLELIVVETDQVILVYTKPGDEWCPLCDNLLTGCGSAGLLPSPCIQIPSQLCVKPFVAAAGISTECCPDNTIPTEIQLIFDHIGGGGCYGLSDAVFLLDYIGTGFGGPTWSYVGDVGGFSFSFFLICVDPGNWVFSMSASGGGCTQTYFTPTVTLLACDTLIVDLRIDTDSSCCTSPILAQVREI